MAMLSRIPAGDRWFEDGNHFIQCATADDANQLEKIMNEQSAELARLRDELAEAYNKNGYSLRAWLREKEKCDALAAENRAWHEVTTILYSRHYPGSEEAAELRRLLNQPRTAREVERVKVLETVAAIVEAMHNESHGDMNHMPGKPRAIPLSECRDSRCQALADLDKLSKDGDK